MMFNLGAGELILIFLIVLLLFGAGRLAGIGKGLGEGIRNFRSAMRRDHPDRDQDESGHSSSKGDTK